jgi:hypothetical protein
MVCGRSAAGAGLVSPWRQAEEGRADTTNPFLEALLMRI